MRPVPPPAPPHRSLVTKRIRTRLDQKTTVTLWPGETSDVPAACIVSVRLPPASCNRLSQSQEEGSHMSTTLAIIGGIVIVLGASAKIPHAAATLIRA